MLTFLFDVDGLLVNSHEFQAKALKESFDEFIRASNKQIESRAPTYEEILHIAVGSNESTAVPLLAKLVPELSDVFTNLIKHAWGLYFANIESHPKEFAITSSVDLLRLLHERGFPVCLVSNSNRSDILKYCNLIDVEFISGISNGIVSFESCSEPKPSPALYLQAMRQLGVNSQDCVAFEDSVQGIRAASNANIHTIGLQKEYTNSEALFEAGASEVVSVLSSSDKVMLELEKNTDRVC